MNAPYPPPPGRKQRRARLELRFAEVTLRRPDKPGPEAPAELVVSAVDVREIDPVQGVALVHWLIVTTYPIDNTAKAAETVDLYRGRFLIEQLFRTLKTAGFNIESVELGDPKALMAFTGFALLAATSIMQLVKARDGKTGQLLSHAFEADAFEADDRPLLLALSHTLEGKTEKRKKPHPPDDLAFAAWVMARLAGWNCYYGKPGPETMRNGHQRYHAIKLGTKAAKDV